MFRNTLFTVYKVRFRKLVNAKYCDRFPVVRWKDGKVVHVQVTPELHRTYEQKVLTALRAVQNRIDWLNQGSRALFGTLIEEQLYILIDTSESMVPSIQYVKDKLFLLMQVCALYFKCHLSEICKYLWLIVELLFLIQECLSHTTVSH